jgi:arginine utilization regulatory protein
MGRTDNDILRLFPGADLSRISFLPLLKDFFEGVTITDRHGCVLFVNDEQARIDDMPAAMLSGKKITDIYQVVDGVSPVMQCIKTRRPVKGLACYYRTCTGRVANSIHNVFPLFEGTAREFAECVDAARLSARSVSPVMLFGETGTGKELLAQSIHNRSSRSRGRYVAVNCAAIPENLLEGILFGTTRGAFTGAVDKPGLFEKAHGGTLLLDEINAMTMGLQAKLLRFLQERKIRRVGSLEERDVDLKIISSVNVNPHVAIAQQTLRADLFYRLAVIFIRIPPLRDWLQDLPALISHFLSKSNALLNRQIAGLSEEVMSRFEHYPWPGNVQELEHVIEGALSDTLGRPSDAAARLGISPQLMNYKMKKYRINRRDYQ